jgi:branched-chain amino acid transport system substrate-binding protein
MFVTTQARRALALGAVAFAFAGCGGAATDDADSDTPIKIGVLTSLTGPQAQPGKDVLDAVELYTEQHPELQGRKVELVVEDDAGDPQRGVARVRKLLTRDEVDMVVGVVNSAVLNAVKDQILSRKVPFIVTVAGSNDFTEPGDPNAFRAGMANEQFNRALGWYAYEKLRKRKVAVITLDYVAGEEHARGFKDVFTSLGGKIVAEQKPPLGTPDFAPYISRIPRDVDALYVFLAGADAVKFWKQARSFGLTKRTQIVGPFATADTLVLQAVGEAADGFVGAGGYVNELETPANEAFLKAYEKSAGRPPTIYAEQSYTGMIAIDRALQQADGETGEAFSRALAKVTFDDSPRGSFALDAHRQAVLTTYFYEVEGGRAKVVGEVPDVDQNWEPARR